MTTANPFATQAAQPAASTNPFAAQPPVQTQPAPPPVHAPAAPPGAVGPGVQAIAAAFAAQPATPNPFAPLSPPPTGQVARDMVAMSTQLASALVQHAQQPLPYPTLNPPGERVTALGDAGAPAAPAPVAAAPVEPPTPPAPAEPRRRTRRGATNAGGMPGVVAAAPTSVPDAEAQFTTEQIVELLIERGYTVALTREPA